MAAGARISFAEALLLNVRGEVLGLRDEGCTAFAVGRGLTAAGGVIAGQNSDQAAWNEEVLVILKIRPDTGPSAVICTHAGLIGYHGCNAAGVGQFANAVPAAGRWPGGMPHYLMKRRLLAQTNVAGCLDVLRGARVASPANYVLADRDGALLDAEITPTALATLDAEGDLIVHTNHYVHPIFRSHNDAMPSLTGSACRAARLAELVRAAAGRVTAETMQHALADQASEPEQICSPAGGPHGKTVASLVAELDQGRLHVARGGAATGTYVTYRGGVARPAGGSPAARDDKRGRQRNVSYPYGGTQLRPSVTGRRGMVSSAHAQASLAGLRTLMEGGNAIDAAVAVASCIGATEDGALRYRRGWLDADLPRKNKHPHLSGLPGGESIRRRTQRF